MFTLHFNRPPDFSSIDQYGRHQDSFQYFIVGDATLPYPENFDAIIRGEEMTVNGSQGLLPIRSSGPPVQEPGAGGWGAIREIVPVSLGRAVLEFSAPLSTLSDDSTDGRFAYLLETYNFGGSIEQIASESVVRR